MKSFWRFTMSTKEQQVQEMTNVIAKFIAYVAKKLPDDVEAKIKELAADEKNPLAKTIYETIEKESGIGLRFKSSILPRYRCVTVLGKSRF